ncbi:MAG: periplasmic heavy metal sensor [Prolixibacteraceae bacterium]|nr:periplasmic heavy metal sensor [Prolixibacteraceae bacterium]MBN2773106.1 periplasmic heavy metal sensor [Prolixibacteraceae bacterium]
MEKRKTYRLLVWIIVILLATNISMAVSFLVHKNNDKQEAQQQTEEVTGIPEEQRTRFFREQLNLTQEQMEPFREFNREYNRASNLIARDLADLRTQMIVELGKEESDREKLDEISTEIGNLHKELKNITIDYYNKMNQVCDPQQRKKLNEMFLSLLEKTERGTQQPRGHKYRFRNQ